MLKVCELKKEFNLINNIDIIEDRIFITDAIDSLYYVKYDDKNNQLLLIADDLLPFHVSS